MGEKPDDLSDREHTKKKISREIRKETLEMKYSHETRAKLAKPCPFCGCTIINVRSREDYENSGSMNGTMHMDCNKCGSELWSFPRSRSDMYYPEAYREMLKKWNRRAA